METYTPDKLFAYGSGAVTVGAGIFTAIWKLLKKKKTDVNPCADCGLCRHKFFQIMDSFLLNVERADWKCINEYKTQVAKDMVRIKFNIGKKRIKEWICANQNIADSKTLRDDFNDMIVNMISEYENQWIAAGVNKLVIDRLSLYHNSNARYAVRMGSGELDKDYNDTKNSLHHLLDSLIIPYSMFIADVRNVMDSFNGALKDDVYKGIKNSGEHIDLEITRLRLSYEE